MKKKILVIALAVAMLALPMVSVAQAKPVGVPTEIFHDVMIWGIILPDIPAEVDVMVQGNIQYGRYTAQCYGTDGVNWFPGVWISYDGEMMVDAQLLSGTATYDVDYKINTNTLKGVVHLAALITLGEMTPDTSDDGTFEGDIFLIGELLLLPDDTVSIPVPQGENSMWHAFFKGTGAYEGWTIVQNMNANPPWFEPILTGSIVAGDSHLIKPIDE